MHPVEQFLREVSEVRRSGAGTGETSYYPALAALLSEVGAGLKPWVRAVSQLANRGKGQPDFGLFEKSQFQRAGEAEPLEGAKPTRGVVEAKGPSACVAKVAASPQTAKYLAGYGAVLVTNLREFLLVGTDEHGGRRDLEGFSLAASESEFWSEAVAHPRRAAERHGDRLLDYLRRVLLHRAPLSAPEDVAWFLASYAREAKARVEEAGNLPALAATRTALEESLDLRFEGAEGEGFFRSTLVQTLFYGVFSAWVLWAKDHPPTSRARFDWQKAAWTLRVPTIRALFSQVATPDRLGPLGVSEVLDWTSERLNDVDRAAFFDRFGEEHAVQHFYEPFLQAFDPELRKRLGVWYTPPEVVRYMVARVDTVLREELDLPDGLADPRVHVLDPCCGTGAFLVEVLRKIAETLREKGVEGLVASDLRRAAKERVHGFELLPAPFVVAHLQLGLLLAREGAPLSENKGDRVGVFLTNALTGWEPQTKEANLRLAQLQMHFPELAEESASARAVKQESPILVVIGNPPYNAYSGTATGEEAGLVDVYKARLSESPSTGGWGIRKYNLDDLYIRFFRIAERRIVKTGRGIVCFISNHSYISDPSYVVFREKMLREFDLIEIADLHGDSRETGKLTPEGAPDPSVFSTEFNREGIRVGTAVGLFARFPNRHKTALVRYAEFRGSGKRESLLGSLSRKRVGVRVAPAKSMRFALSPVSVSKGYLAWPKVTELCADPPSNGLMEKRGGSLFDIDRERLAGRMRAYLDWRLEWEEVRERIAGLADAKGRFDPRASRRRLVSAETFDPERVVRYSLRPFDAVWCYYSPTRPLWNEPRPALWRQYRQGNSFFVTRPHRAAEPEGVPAFFTRLLGDNDFQRGHAYYFHVISHPGEAEAGAACDGGGGSIFEDAPTYGLPRANLSDRVRGLLKSLGFADPDQSLEAAETPWLHALAICHSPAFLAENDDGLRQDWPRVPLPAKREALLASADLGRAVAALLDTEAPVPGVTSGAIRPELRALANPVRDGGAALDEDAGDFAVTAGWGHAGKGGATMPGKGRVRVRDYTSEERAALARAEGLPEAAVLAALGERTLDVFLNDAACWRNVPERVWEYTLGGYQVAKKWLSYREKALLGRDLRVEEVRYFGEMIRRIAALLLLAPALDASYRACAEETWPGG